MRLTLPAMGLARQPVGEVEPAIEGTQVTLGPFVLTYDGKAGTLAGAASWPWGGLRARRAWRYGMEAPDEGAWGFPGSPAVGAGRVFVTGIDGRVLAFAQ